MQLIVLFILAYALKAAWEDARKGWRTSRDAYMRSAGRRFPEMPRSRRAAHALRHDAGYWAGQLFHGFPASRHGFATGWHAGRAAQYQGQAARERAKTEGLEARASVAEQVAGWRARQDEALRRTREAGRPAGAGREGGGEGGPGMVREHIIDDVPGDGRTWSWGPARSPYHWPCPAGPKSAHRQARHMSTDGTPYDVCWYPPGGGPGVTDATYLGGDLYLPDPAERAAWTAGADRQRKDDRASGRVWSPQDLGDCYLCGLLLAAGEHDAHQRCKEAYERNCAENEVRDNRDIPEVERDLRAAGRCPWQIRPAGWDGGAVYCGQLITDAGGDLPDLFCPQHQAEADGDDEGAAQELNEHVQAILERGAQPERLAITQGGTTVSDVTYDGIIASMSAAVARAEGSAAEQQQAGQQASAMADQAQALGVDPATLSAMADHLDAHDAATQALRRVQETAEAVEAALKQGHAGLAEAHANAPVTAADREFYQQ